MNRSVSITADGEILYDDERPAAEKKLAKKAPKKKAISVFDLLDVIGNEEAATAFFEHQRWGDSPKCPRCGTRDITYVPNQNPQPYHCPDCRRYFSVKTGTVMQGSSTPLRKWLYAIYQFHCSPNGISARQLAREIGVTRKCAWHMGHRLREAMRFRGPLLSGEVEADETYIGGKEPNKHYNKRKDGPAPKQAILAGQSRLNERQRRHWNWQ